ncbi:hypothetical protein Ancab_033042 [Ancistrocladus abbreviatus]
MVLWELTVATAYFLGLKRTYRLALKIQRRLISPKHPQIRQFLHRRTRAVFDIALSVHRNIQQRDIEVGRNLGNWILRWLHRIKPSANIRGPPHEQPRAHNNINSTMTKQVADKRQKILSRFQRSRSQRFDQGPDRHLFSAPTSTWRKSFPTIAMMLRPEKPAAATTPFRHLCINGPEVVKASYGRQGFEGVIRKDILQWMQRD